MENIEIVLDFIDETIALFEMEDFAQGNQISAEHYFTRGGCGEFYKILKSEFPQAQMYLTYGYGHVLTEIDGILYDVRGIYSLEPEEYILATPEMEKICSNYAFTLTMDGEEGNFGPTNAIFLEVIHNMSEDEKESFFYDEYTDGFYEMEYDEYLGSEEYQDVLLAELEGIPILSF